MKLLPREPTPEMINAGIDAQDYVESYVNEIYRAMYDAAPSPTGGEVMIDYIDQRYEEYDRAERTKELSRLRARVAELEAEITEQRRLRDYFSGRMARLDTAAREAMSLLDQQEPRPEAALGVLLCALNPDLPFWKVSDE